jgi:hypothetical protein
MLALSGGPCRGAGACRRRALLAVERATRHIMKRRDFT